MNEVRPEDVQYPAMLRRIREQLDMGLTVYVDHCEFGTSKKLVLVRSTALTGAHLPPSYIDYILLTWLYTGSMWVPGGATMDSYYVMEKLKIHWDDDAKSICAFMRNLALVGHDEPLRLAKDMR